MSRFEWKSDYETGNDVIDLQHKALVEAANILHQDIVFEKEGVVLKKSFDFLLQYTKQHFKDEEEYLSEIRSLLLAAQRQEHQALAEEINAMWLDDQLGFIDGLKEAVEYWVEERLVRHMIEADQDAIRRVETA